jgi:hypothetical protein
MVTENVPSPSFELDTAPVVVLPVVLGAEAEFPFGCRPWRRTIKAAGLIVVMAFPKTDISFRKATEQGPGHGETSRFAGFSHARARSAAKTSGKLRPAGANPALAVDKN